MAGADLTTALLRRVSRSFYLSLAVLPPAVRPTIGLAYLLARASDTIADTRLIDRGCVNCHSNLHGSNAPAMRGQFFLR